MSKAADKLGIHWTKLNVVYTGSIYYGKQDPAKVMQAIRELIDEGKIGPFDILVHFYGDGLDWVIDEAVKYDLGGVVVYYGRVPLEEALQKQREADILLVFKWEDPKEDGVYPAKVFEYLGAGRPILATGGHGDVVTELLEETNAGVDCPTVEDIKRQLIIWVSAVLTPEP